MEKLVVIGPYTRKMKDSIEKYLPDGVTLEYITEYEQYPVLEDADYIILRTLRLDASHIQQLKKAKLIQRWGAGYDTVDVAAAGAKNIQAAVCAGVNAQSVAELAVLDMLAVYRSLIQQALAFAVGEDKRTVLSADSHCISGKTVGIFGMGNIGRRVCKMVRAFGAEVIYYDVFRLDETREQELGCRYGTIDEVLSQSDIVSLHLPLLDSTRHFIDAEAIGKMKDGAVLINTARQELIVEEDLANALRSGKLMGAGLDEVAGAVKDGPFAGLNNVICTPHIGGSTADINDEMAKICMQHIEAIRDGKRLTPPALVNGAYL